MADGERVPSPIAPAIYHPIEYGLVDAKDGNRMFDWLVHRLTSAYGVVRVDDWYPISWSHNVYSPLETANAAIAAYKLRRAEAGYKMLCAIAKGALHGAVVPGSISCVASSTGYTSNGTDFGDGNSLYLRCIVEGLFGIEMNVPQGYVSLLPNFPRNWTHAQMSIPDVTVYRYKENVSGHNGGSSFQLQFPRALRVVASVPVSGNAKAVIANGTPVRFTVKDYRGRNFVSFTTPKSRDFRIDIRYATRSEWNDSASEKDMHALTSEVELIPASICMNSAGPLGRLKYEEVPLRSCETLPFADVYELYPGEQTWGTSDRKKCEWSPRFGDGDTVLLTSQVGVPFAFDKKNVVAVEKLHENAVWKGPKTNVNVPDHLTIPVDKPAQEVFLLLSGFSSPMTCHLPQIRIDLNYANGATRRYELTTPYEIDFISQHTSIHPAESIDSSGSLHADVIHLKGDKAALKSITIKALQRQSGIVLYGLTVAQARI